MTEAPEVSILNNPVRPLKVALPKPARPSKAGRLVSALLYGDTHIPHHDPAAVAVVQAIARETTPDLIVHMGYLLDCYTLSRWDKNPERRETLQDEIDAARQHIAQMRLCSPNSRFVLLEGNHEDRLRRTLWNLDGPAAVLAQLTAFKQAMTWPALLGLDELGAEFVPYGEQSKHRFLPKFLLKHGTVVRNKSAYTACGEHYKYGMSGASGHTHRLGQFYHRDHNGNHVWSETGCTCRLDPEYAPDPDWQQGCVFLTLDTQTGAVQAEPVYIHNGTAVFRGAFYRNGNTA